MLLLLLILWAISFLFSFGVPGFIFVLMKHAAKKPWHIKTDANYKPTVSILVPTLNEADIIRLKLENLIKVRYPRDKMKIIVVDSCSEDDTITIVSEFVKQHPECNIQILTERERKGKSAALNHALKHCDGEVIVVSDADCFWPSDILEKALPFLADTRVGAISGPKILLNSGQSWITKSEDAYLNLMNLIKLGESKEDSTLLFEGGFSAYKKAALTSFDPYSTGSDDCGTVLKLIECGYRALLVTEARFYSAFPITWKGKVTIKVRRVNQIIRILWRYFYLLLKRRIKGSKKLVIRGLLLYIVSPLMFIIFIITTMLLVLIFPYLALLLLLFLIPKLRFYLFEVVQSYLLLLLSMITVFFKKKFIVWNKPEDRMFINEKILMEFRL